MYKDCIAAIEAAAGRKMSEDELTALYEGLQKYIRDRQRANKGEGLDASIRAAADNYAADMAELAVIEKRNAILALQSRLDKVSYVRDQFANDPYSGVSARLVGVESNKAGSRLSAAAEQENLKSAYLSGFIADMHANADWHLFVSGTLDREIATALWAENRAQPIPRDVPKQAEAMAKVISKWQEVARQDANKAGAWIKKLEGYIVRQSHDMYKIHGAGFDAWKADALNWLDIPRTFGDAGPTDKTLQQIWSDLASGIHLRPLAEDTPAKPSANMAKRLSQSRVLHFKDAGAWFDYNAKYGTGTMREAVLGGLGHNADTTGLMRVWGPNPQSTFDQVTHEIMNGISDPSARRVFADRTAGALRNQLMAVDGSMNIPVNHMGAKWATTIRAGNRMSKLGASLLSQFSDIAFYGSEMKFQGRGFLSGMAESIASLGQNLTKAEKVRLMGMIGVYADSSIGDFHARFSLAEDGAAGAFTKLQQQFFKWNGMTWWSDRQRVGAQFGLSHYIAQNADREWGKVNGDLQRVLGLYGIDAKEWDVIRKSGLIKGDDGRSLVVPENIKDAKIRDKYRTYLIDRSQYAQLRPDAATRATMIRGTRPGTVEGEFMRFIGEFKSFSVVAFQRTIKREIYGRGANSFAEALKNGNGEMTGLAQLMAWTVLFGYTSMVAKDFVKGRNPRDPLSKKTWIAAMAQGGGMGIYGDFLFGEVKNRFGGSLADTLLGPTLGGSLNTVGDLYGRARDGDPLAAPALRAVISNAPFINVFYSKMALDYLFLYSLQEAMNPGSLQRMESRIQKQNAQTFWLRPSQNRYRGVENLVR